ncbi:MAG TPA: hypothetical protein VG756_02625 [Pseudonocardiaceae bacterium]|nr:hypothetical protein [Pseudonocardiaceae bacterium]
MSTLAANASWPAAPLPEDVPNRLILLDLVRLGGFRVHPDRCRIPCTATIRPPMPPPSPNG